MTSLVYILGSLMLFFSENWKLCNYKYHWLPELGTLLTTLRILIKLTNVLETIVQLIQLTKKVTWNQQGNLVNFMKFRLNS